MPEKVECSDVIHTSWHYHRCTMILHHYYLVSGREREGQGEGKKEFGMRAGEGGGGGGGGGGGSRLSVPP